MFHDVIIWSISLSRISLGTAIISVHVVYLLSVMIGFSALLAMISEYHLSKKRPPFNVFLLISAPIPIMTPTPKSTPFQYCDITVHAVRVQINRGSSSLIAHIHNATLQKTVVFVYVLQLLCPCMYTIIYSFKWITSRQDLGTTSPFSSPLDP